MSGERAGKYGFGSNKEKGSSSQGFRPASRSNSQSNTRYDSRSYRGTSSGSNGSSRGFGRANRDESSRDRFDRPRYDDRRSSRDGYGGNGGSGGYSGYSGYRGSRARDGERSSDGRSQYFKPRNYSQKPKRENALKETLYWCTECNLPLLARTCSCGKEESVIEFTLVKPYELRPALKSDMLLINRLIHERFGDGVKLSDVLLLNKSGGTDRADLVIMNGVRLGWLLYDPVSHGYLLDLSAESLPYILESVTKGIVDISEVTEYTKDMGRIGGKKIRLTTDAIKKGLVTDGTVIVKYKAKYGTGVVSLKDGTLKVRELAAVDIIPQTSVKNPSWSDVIAANKYHLKNIERSAIRVIKQHMNDKPIVNVSFSGGKDSTAVLHLSKKAGVNDAFFIDTGLEFPETIEFVKSQGVHIIEKGGDFFKGVVRAGPPSKDNRWCCKILKLHPLKAYLASVGSCVTIQGNRWYESWNRAGLDETNQNPDNPLQLNISPIRSWRALEVYLYLWWQNVAMNPLYDMGLERIGCFLCPAMLESEFEELQVINPEYYKRWSDFLEEWSAKKGYPAEYKDWGLWRWKVMPPKMRELCAANAVELNRDGTVKTGEPRLLESSISKSNDTAVASEDFSKLDPMGIAEALKEDVYSSAPVAPISSLSPANEDEAVFSNIRDDFKILGDVVYFDTAAMSFSPESVIESVCDFERNYRSNVGRGIHRLAQISSQKYWHAHEKVADFIGGSDGVLIFTKNTTESINIVALGLDLKEGDRVLTTVLEHHSDLLPWLSLVKKGVAVDVVGLDPNSPDYTIDLEEFKRAITPQTKIAAVIHASNVTGSVLPIKEISEICHEKGVLLLVDGAQSAPHMPIDVTKLGCDFFAFSGHKMLGPSGTGALWMKKECMNVVKPVICGGGMVDLVNTDLSGFTTQPDYRAYEAGTPNVSGGIGFGAAVDYLSKIGMDKVLAHERILCERLIAGLEKIEGVTLFVPADPSRRIGVVSFNVEGYYPHEVAQLLDENSDVMVRSGVHCCQPLMRALGTPEGSVRASIGIYNTEQDVDLLITAVKELVSQ